MKIKLFGTKIFISFPFCVVLCLMILIDKTGFIMPTLLAAALHETGHLFALWATDNPPLSIELIPAGVRITKRNDYMAKHTVFCALSGPFLNLAVAFCAGLNYMMYNKAGILVFAAVNIVLGIFNLFPAFGLDGGTVLLSLLEKKCALKTAQNILRALSLLFAFVFIILFVVLRKNGVLNLSVFIAALYLIICAVFMIRE